MNIKLRNETEADYSIAEEITREAFWNHHGPGCDEHYLLHVMRSKEAFIKELDYVAEVNGKIVGNIVYAKSKIIGDDKVSHEIITFGPISVLPEYQGKGIGGMLINHTKELAKELGYRAILIYGDPDYYKKFGFIEAESYDIRTADNMYAVPLQALELYPNTLRECAGCFVEGPAYEYDEKNAEEFDKSFSEKAKLSGLPSQERFNQLVKMRKPRRVRD